jgi:hypothetical protein
MPFFAGYAAPAVRWIGSRLYPQVAVHIRPQLLDLPYGMRLDAFAAEVIALPANAHLPVRSSSRASSHPGSPSGVAAPWRRSQACFRDRYDAGCRGDRGRATTFLSA